MNTPPPDQPPAEEFVLYVLPTTNDTNDYVNQHYSVHAKNHFAQSVKCNDGLTRALWRVSLELIAELAKATPALGMVIYKKPVSKREKPAAPISIDYLKRSGKLPS